MTDEASSSWDGSVARGRALQRDMAASVALKDAYPKPLRTIAGFAVRFGQGGAVARAAAVLLDAGDLRPIAIEVAQVPVTMPRVPGMLGFRAMPALLAALERLPQAPDLAFVAGQGIAHPRRLGVAAHFGVVTGLPSIGVARKILFGHGILPHPTRGAYTALRVGNAQIGWLLRSQVNRDPLVISPGHRVAMGSAADLVMRFVTTHRLPEPTRLARRLATGRDVR